MQYFLKIKKLKGEEKRKKQRVFFFLGIISCDIMRKRL